MPRLRRKTKEGRRRLRIVEGRRKKKARPPIKKLLLWAILAALFSPCSSHNFDIVRYIPIGTSDIKNAHHSIATSLQAWSVALNLMTHDIAGLLLNPAAGLRRGCY